MTAVSPDLKFLKAAYRDRSLTPSGVVEAVYDRMEERGNDPTWISRLPRGEALARAQAVEEAEGRLKDSAVFGAPFAIKDNIDFAGLPTTCACPEFAYSPQSSSPVVQRLLDAGALPIGKTNLDQFATGLVGVRSPYGVPVNPFHADYIPGGSSSGSAVAVASGLCSFALGTDTAGSGRVPAAFNNLVGLKPSRGLLSTRGLVPACRTLDCISILARTVSDAAAVLALAAGFDPQDPYSRHASVPLLDTPWPPTLGIPRRDQLPFFGNTEAEILYDAALARWTKLGARLIEIDFDPFAQAARLLYEGAWVGERYAALRTFVEANPAALHPVTRQIIAPAKHLVAADAFDGFYRLAALQRRTEEILASVDALLTPTVGTAYTLKEVEADPIRLNSNLGHYTNYLNLLDLCGIAVPAGFLPTGVPWGVTLVASRFHDDQLLRLAARFLGEEEPARALRSSGAWTRIAVCGAHLSGLPLNSQLLERGAKLVRATCTAPRYKLYALPGTTPPKPGLVRVAQGGAAVALEVWELPTAAFGDFVSRIPSPLGIGSISLEDGESVQGFLCEAAATAGARDITAFGGWRAFLESCR
jgi:allophanate hydrolase